MPRLVAPTAVVHASYLAGERDDCLDGNGVPEWLEQAEADFDAFAAERRQVRRLWDVPTTELWYVDDVTYIGTLVIRHRLTTRLERDGGHIGYNVVPALRRRGHATAMLAEALPHCHALGLTRVLLTCEVDNIGSRKTIEANDGRLHQDHDDQPGICRYWIALQS